MVAKVQHDAVEAAVGCSKIEPVAAAYKCELAMFGKKKEGWEKKKEGRRERERLQWTLSLTAILKKGSF